MFKNSVINNFVKIGIRTWLNSICTSIDIDIINLYLNKNYFGKVDSIYLEARNVIYKDFYINKIIININDCYIKFNYRNQFVYSEDLIIKSSLIMDNKNLENTFLSNKWERSRINIEKVLTEGQVISNIDIINDLIYFSYFLDELSRDIIIDLILKDNLIFLENINNKNKIFLPLDKNIKFNSCYIKNELLHIDLSSKVIFEN